MPLRKQKCLGMGHIMAKEAGMSISYDQITGRIIDLRQTRDQTNWEAGDLCWYAMERMGANASMLAADTGYSAQHIRDLAKTSQVFHTPDDRRPREYVEWSHYKIAARTDSPGYWIDQAEAYGWSTRELQRQIGAGKEEPDPFDAAKRALRAVERVIEAGGGAAEWIIEQLHQFLSPQSGSGSAGKGLTDPPASSASIAG